MCPADPELEVDPSLDNDSAYSDDMLSYATSISSSVKHYREEHGRRFHAYKEGSYNFPNDEKEQDRLDMVHHMNLLSMGGKLFYAPVRNPKRILDIGTGTGIWAIEAADAFPQAEVVGNDLSPIQPQWVPPNIRFEVDDAEAAWPARAPFDLIHARYMAGSIGDWPALLRRCRDNLAPGGWAEFQDYDCRYYADDASVPPDSPLARLSAFLKQGCEKVGRVIDPGHQLEAWVKEAGFVNVEVRRIKQPIGAWPKDKTLKQIGSFNVVQTMEGLEAFDMALFTRVLGWTKEEVDVFNAKVKQVLKDKSVHPILDFWVVWGQKPE